MSCKVQVQNIKDWMQNKSILSEDQKKELAQKKDNSSVKDPQASTSAKKRKEKPKGKEQVNSALPSELQKSKKEKKAMENVFNTARTLIKFKNKEEERINQYFPKKLQALRYILHTQIGHNHLQKKF
ncbi:hypothetical protein O181_006917 [Austropuccinia psidii MF-1]|uniref:Uncharacterized protein n=1 Tax=Austropuccinia psidii MF-1 TaxID=1389203 RepID=A0A9Q3GI00_9BASI|nr:hypothetical protein [Austropuccinia psidii MF-1]